MPFTVIVSIFCFSLGVLLGAYLISKKLVNTILVWMELSDKHLLLFEASIKWIQLKQQNKKILDYLLSIGCRKIGIYGMSYLGKRLYDEIKDSSLEVIYGIDKDALNKVNNEIPVILPDEVDNRVDTIIVTSITHYEEIRTYLLKRLDNKVNILSLETLLFEA